MAETYKNTSGHPVDTDDGRVIPAGDFAKDLDTRGPLAKAAIEAGQLVKVPPREKAEKPSKDKENS